jgi:uncharacterized protein (TIGR04255 family)
MVYPHLSRAPIVEGLVDIQVKQRPDWSVEQLSPYVENLRDSYPEAKSLQQIRAELKLEVDKPSTQAVEARPGGYRLERQSPPFVILARREGFTVSRMTPYDTWKNLVAEARPRWEEYCRACKPEAITRVATRFINRIELPIEGLDFDDYFTATPKVPQGLPQTLAHFLSRIIVPDRNSGADIAISQVMEAMNPSTQKVVVLIDIDVYKNLDLSVDSGELWDLLNTLRELKNCAFFDSLTPRALELFK